MKPNRPSNPSGKPAPPQISAANFPALRQFLRGYLHEDWQDEHDSPAAAAQQFCEDASPKELENVAREWKAFRKETKNLSLPAISSLLNGELGAAWRLKTPDALEAISSVFQRFTPKT